jgi:alpha-galactosidase
MIRPLTIVLAALTALQFAIASSAQQKSVAVIILAGQSNMEGKAQNVLWEHQAIADDTAEFFAPFRDQKNKKWVTRDDVFIKYLGRHGRLTLGYGSPNRTGLEYAFGLRVGDALKEPVLLIKTAWGGRSIRKDFRSPSAGLPSDEVLAKELAQAQKNVANRNKKNKRDDALPTMGDYTLGYGKDYRAMMAEVQATMKNYGELFPELKGRKLDLRGFVWFQGWNDQYGGAELEYEQNMTHFIKDVRKDLAQPALPFVIGVMGQNGKKPAKGAMATIQAAQLAMEKVPEFVGNVRAVPTDALQDEAAAALYPEWKKRMEEWQRTGSDHAYHYLGSAIWFSRIGYQLAEATLALQQRK